MLKNELKELRLAAFLSTLQLTCANSWHFSELTCCTAEFLFHSTADILGLLALFCTGGEDILHCRVWDAQKRPWPPPTSYQYRPLPHEWQSQMSPNIAKCPLGTASPSVKIHCYNEDFKDFVKRVLWIFMLYKITHNKIKPSELQKYCLDIRNESRGLPGGCAWRVCLPTQETQVQSLNWEGPACCRATKLLSRSYWACALGPGGLQLLSPAPQVLQPAGPRACVSQEKPAQ